MNRTRTLLAACLAATFAIASLGQSATAVEKTKLAVVNGIPGRKVAVCVNNKRVRAAMPYGGYVIKTVKKPKATIKFYKPGLATARCQGQLIKKKVVDKPDATVVLTKGPSKRVVVFDNEFFGWTTLDVGVGIASASDKSLVNIMHDRRAFFSGGTGATYGSMLEKAEASRWSHADDGKLWYDAAIVHVPTTGRVVAGPVVKREKPGYRLEFIVVGTTWGNTKLVTIRRPM